MNQSFSVVIPTTAKPEGEGSLVETLVDSLMAIRDETFEVVVVADLNSRSKKVINRLQLLDQERIKVVEFNEKFNFSRKCNVGAQHSKYGILVFLNDDIFISDRNSLGKLVALAAEKSVGAVGCVLTYPNGSVQHAGITMQSKKPKNALAGKPIEALSKLGNNPYKVSAVTGACLAIAQEKFKDVGYWDESFPNSYNDIDLCLTLIEKGYTNFVVPSVRLVHLEAQSRDESFDIRDFEKLWKKHGCKLGIEQYLPNEQFDNRASEGIIKQLKNLGVRRSFWAIFYRLNGKSRRYLGE